MSEGRLKTGVLGLDEGGRILLQAASGPAAAGFQIVAVADNNGDLARQFAAQYNCAAYDDYRQFVIQNELDCLLVAAPIHTCTEYIKAAIRKKFNIFKLPPPARDFAETAELVHLAREQSVKFVVANPLRFAQAFVAFDQHIRQAGLEKVLLIDIVCNAAARAFPAWQTDPKLAGGGVLLNDCFAVIDLVVSSIGLPQQVYCLNVSAAGDKQQRLYLTEDATVVTMKFSDTLLGNLRASRVCGPATGGQATGGQQSISVFSRDGILTASESQLLVCDAVGQVSEKYEYPYDHLHCISEHLASFASSILTPDKIKPSDGAGPGRAEHLLSMAVIEAAYLSARTLMPEQPQKILAMKK